VKVYISPHPSGYHEDGRGSGGIWRIINAQAAYLPECGVEIVDNPMEADVTNIHAGSLIDTYAPIVQSCHGYYWTGDFEWARKYWDFNTAVVEASRRAAEIIVPAEWVAVPIRRDMRKSPHIIQHGVTIEEFEPAEAHSDYILWAKPRVDVVSTPEPMNELARRVPDVKFISTFGVPQRNVKIIGAQRYANFSKVMRRAAVWLATTRETGDIASREAMALAIPVLGWDWGATGELVMHKETGYLARPGDYDDLREGLDYCLTHRNRLGNAAREYIRQYCQWQDIVPLYVEVYRQALERNQYPVKVSVVIPTYNYAHFLPECLTSVLQQNMFDFEAIIVDDGSTDNTPEILAAYERDFENIRVIRQNNQGLCGALNTGHRAARGKYIVNLDPDNLLSANALSLLSQAMDDQPWIDVASGGLAFYAEDGHHYLNRDWPSGTINPLYQLQHINQLHSSSMMRSKSVKRLGGYRQRQFKNEDGEFWCRVMSAGLRCKQVTKEATLIYRWHDNNKSKAEGGEDDPEGPLSWNFHYPWRKRWNTMPFAMTGHPPYGSWPVRSYDNPHIAVIIACGPNHDRYLPDALDSVAGQTFTGFECIVGNDTGYDIDVASMGHPWAKVVNTKGKQGPAVARNTAIAATKAPLIMPLDADDILYPAALELFYRAWLSDPTHLVYGDCFTEDMPGRRKLYHSGPWSWEKIRKEAIYQVTTLYARQWWEAVGGYDDDVAWEDWIFGLKLHFMGIGATYIDEPWGVYRHWTGRKSDDDAKDFGTPKFKEMLGEVYKYIESKEKAMGCKGCGGRATGSRATRANPQHIEGVIAMEGPEVYVVFDGHRAGGFSLNSKAVRGKKYRVFKDEPFLVVAADAEWIGKLEFFRIIKQQELMPSFPEKPPLPPLIEIGDMPTGAPDPSSLVPAPRLEPKPVSTPLPESPSPVTETSLNASELPGVSERMILAMKAMGIETTQDLRLEFATNGTKRLKMIKGLKERRLEALEKHVGA
jgi:glycosyltransferase involved in cell wall biosynthesis